MADLIFADSHNMMAYMEKSEDNADFTEIVDFLNASPIRYSLTSSGPTTLVADEIVHEKRGYSVERAATTATSLDVEQGSGNINRTQSTTIPNDPFPQGISSSGSPRRQDTIGDSPAQSRFERLSKQSNEQPLSRVNTLNAQALEIQKLKKRVKKLESEKKSRTLQLNRRLFKVMIESSAKKSLGDPEDASKHGRNEIDQDEGISWFQEDSETQGRYGHAIRVNTASTSITTASINITTAEPVTTASAPITAAGVSVSTAEPSTLPTKPKKKNDQIEYDADVAQRVQAELVEEARLERER
ncbi:hypothetical protein Tco_0496274 [Tanacetum coccineum]